LRRSYGLPGEVNATEYHQRLRELSRGKRHRLLVGRCPGCCREDVKPYFRGRFASEGKPVVIDYFVCKSYAKKLESPRKRQRMADTIEANLETLGAFELSTRRGEA
jgi:hypothetical protein